MKLALASVDFINEFAEYNFNQILTFSKQAKERKADLIYFGRAFLQVLIV